MNNAQIVESRTTGRHPLPGEGAIPVSALHFRTGRLEEAKSMVLTHHYSRRVPSNVQMVGSLHLDGGLFGGDGPMVAAAFWTYPPTRWAETVVELARLVRGDERAPLTFLLARCVKELRRHGHDLLVSFADKTQGHEGYVYRAANWRYAGCRERRMDITQCIPQILPDKLANLYAKSATTQRQPATASYLKNSTKPGTITRNPCPAHRATTAAIASATSLVCR
jgi:hypothetical protein